jgi:DNA-binding NarL/FixJ family response regulator
VEDAEAAVPLPEEGPAVRINTTHIPQKSSPTYHQAPRRGNEGPALACASTPHDELTPREREVLRRLALGLSNRDIADALCISEETVKTHVGSVLGKLQVENRAQAIVQALKRGLVTLEELT